MILISIKKIFDMNQFLNTRSDYLAFKGRNVATNGRHCEHARVHEGVADLAKSATTGWRSRPENDGHLAAMQPCGPLKVLADPDRMTLLCQLSQGEHGVSELEAALGIGQPPLAQQL